MEVRPADAEDLPAVATILDAAMLATDDLRERVAAGDVLVADEEGRVLGALVVEAPAAAPAWARERGTAAQIGRAHV